MNRFEYARTADVAEAVRARTADPGAISSPAGRT